LLGKPAGVSSEAAGKIDGSPWGQLDRLSRQPLIGTRHVKPVGLLLGQGQIPSVPAKSIGLSHLAPSCSRPYHMAIKDSVSKADRRANVTPARLLGQSTSQALSF
jgi:hypothetical protein